MRKSILLIGLFIVLLPGFGRAADTPPLAVIESFSGKVAVGAKDSSEWSFATEGMPLSDRQVIRTDAGARAVVVFSEGSLTTTVAEKTTIIVGDLLLRARLEAMRSKVAAPSPGTNAGPTKLTVTPLTGVRGTDQGDSKVEDPLRQHHWEENAPAPGQ